MAWFAYWKWCHSWRKKPLFNWIEWYKEEIKTPEQRAIEEARGKQAVRNMAMLLGVMASMTNYRDCHTKTTRRNK